MLFDRNKAQGRLFSQSFQMHKAVGATVTLAHPALGRYAQPAAILVNGVAGTNRYNDGQWLGLTGNDLDAVIDLGSVRNIRQIGIDVLNYHWQKMWPPVSLQFQTSTDGIHYQELYQQHNFPVNGINVINHSFLPQAARYVKVTGINKGVIPPGEYGAGGQALLLVDEIRID
jgi:hexosaminidase